MTPYQRKKISRCVYNLNEMLTDDDLPILAELKLVTISKILLTDNVEQVLDILSDEKSATEMRIMKDRIN